MGQAGILEEHERIEPLARRNSKNGSHREPTPLCYRVKSEAPALANRPHRAYNRRIQVREDGYGGQSGALRYILRVVCCCHLYVYCLFDHGLA